MSHAIAHPSFVRVTPFLCRRSCKDTCVHNGGRLGGTCGCGVSLHCSFFPGHGGKSVFSIANCFGGLGSPVRRARRSSNNAIVHSFHGTRSKVTAKIRVRFHGRLFGGFHVKTGNSCVCAGIMLPRNKMCASSRHTLRKTSPFLVGTSLDCAPRLEKRDSLALTLICGIRNPHVRAMNVCKANGVGRRALRAVSFVTDCTVGGRLDLHLRVGSLLGDAVHFGRRLPTAKRGIRMRSFHPKADTRVKISCEFWNSPRNRARCLCRWSGE